MTKTHGAAGVLPWGLAMVAVIGLSPTAHARASDPERAELAASRQRIEVDHTRQVARCRQQFVVTSCIEAAAASRREGLAALQARQAELDDQERKQRASARQSRIDAKQQSQKNAPTPVPLVPADSAAAQEAAAEEASRAAGRATHPASVEKGPSKSARAAKSQAVDPRGEAARFDARQQEARDRKAAAAERQKERERSGKAARPSLPAVEGASKSPAVKAEPSR